MRYKLTIAYDGTHYSGWQVQKNSVSIQSLIQKGVETALRHSACLTGSGRTDAGVHALGQTAHFDTELSLDLKRFRNSLNALLPLDIRILQIDPVPNDFHARYSALSKIYHYHLHLDPVSDPFTRLYRSHVLGRFDLEAVREAIPFLIGTHDFTSFANLRGKEEEKDRIRTLSRLDIVDQQGGVRLEFEGNGFLYKMVRNIAGTLIDIGAGRMLSSKIPEILAAKNRSKGGTSAPARALFLMKVVYPREIQSSTSEMVSNDSK